MTSILYKDILTLIKEDNREFRNLKASVLKDKIIVVLPLTSIEEGDVLKREILGSDELYLVLSSMYKTGIHAIPSHYNITFKKIKTLEERNLISQSIPNTQTINIGTINAENVQVGNSNVITIHNNQFDSKINELINELINEIKKQKFSKDKEEEYLEIVEDVKKQLQKEKPKETIIKSLLDTLPTFGNIASIGSMIIALL